MKIFLFSTGFVDYTIGLANSLSAKHEVCLCLPGNSVEDEYEETLDAKINFIPFKMERHRSFRNIFLMKDIYRIIKSFDPEIIHLQSEGHLYFSLLHPFLRSYKIVNTVHDPKIHMGEKGNYIESLIQQFNSFFVSKYIVHGQYLKFQLSNSRKIRHGKISVISHGDYNLYHHWERKKVDEESNTILFFGRIWRYKGLNYLIKAQPIISKYIPDAKIIIAGRGESMEKYISQIDDLEKYEIYNYRISNEETANLFNRASLVVLPYIDGSQSGVIHLAYSFGKPVVATKVGSLGENVDNFKSGILIEPKDYKMIASSIIFLFQNNKKRKDMAKYAKNLSLDKYSWKQISKKTVGLYKQVLQR